jgi:RNA polymerase sigma-70 factor (ECF subfamily)
LLLTADNLPSNNIYNEQELLLRIAKGDEKALSQIYGTFYGALLFFALDLLKDQDQAEDIVIVAFTRLWERRTEFEGMDKLKGFLYQTVRNACYNYLAHLKVQRRVHGEIRQQAAITDHQFAEVRIIKAELLREVWEAVKELPEKYRSVLELSFVQEKSAAEIAKLLAVSIDVVRQRKGRGIYQLREKLGADKLFYIFLTISVMEGQLNCFI